MLRFDREQRVVEVGGVAIGGQPGERATALAGTIFYEGHRVVRDAREGSFDRRRARSLVEAQDSAASECGLPTLLHVFAQTPRAMASYLSFAAEATAGPLVVDSPSLDARLAALRWAVESGSQGRVVYDSLNLTVTPEEVEALRASGVPCSIVLAFNPKEPTLSGRLGILEDGAGLVEGGLLAAAAAAKATKVLIDPAVTPIGNGAGVAVRAALAAKAKWGHPVGSGIHNAPASLPWLRQRGRRVRDAAEAGANVLQVAMCADFLLYGPIEHAPFVFPAVGVADAIVADAAQELGTDVSANTAFSALAG